MDWAVDYKGEVDWEIEYKETEFVDYRVEIRAVDYRFKEIKAVAGI